MHTGTSDTGEGFFPAAEDEFGDGLAHSLRARVKSELEPGERLLWAGQSASPPAPMGIAFFVWGAIALLVFFLGTIALVAGLTRPRRSDDGNPTILGILLDTVSGIIIVSMIGHRISKRIERVRQASVCYAVTDRRAISWIPEPNGGAVRVRSLHRGQIRDVVRVQRPDGSGTLEFSLSPEAHHSWEKEEFKHIPEVRRAEQIVRYNLIAPDKTT
jgi:hypothetical protein